MSGTQRSPSRRDEVRVEFLLGRGPSMGIATVVAHVFLAMVAARTGTTAAEIVPWLVVALISGVAFVGVTVLYSAEPERYDPWRWELLAWIVSISCGLCWTAWMWIYMPWDEHVLVASVIAAAVALWIGTAQWLAASQGAFLAYSAAAGGGSLLAVWVNGGEYRPLAPMSLVLGIAIGLVRIEHEHTVTHQIDDRLELERSATLQQAVFDTMDDAVVTVANGHIGTCNSRFAELVGWDEHDLRGRVAASVIPELGLSARLADGRPMSVLIHPPDRPGPAHLTLRGRNVPGYANHQVWVCVDETDRVRDDHAIRTLAARDDLTGMLNRRALRQLLDNLWQGGRLPVGLLLIDLDGFKQVNDQHGHDTGDQVLHAISAQLTAALPTATLGRLGGDEFVAIVHGGTQDTLEDAATAACAAARTPVDLSPGRFTLAASVGVTLVRSSMDRSVALRLADEAMYRAKRAGGDQWVMAES